MKKKDLEEFLAKYFPQEKIKRNFLSSRYVTLQAGVELPLVLMIEDFLDWERLGRFLKDYKEPLEIGVIGGGSNLVIISGKKDLYLLNRWHKKKIISSDDKYTYLKVSSGYPIFKLVKETVELGLSGLEYHWGLPGTLGGAVYMNSKWTKPLAYVGDVVEKVLLLDKKGEFRWEPREYLKFDYDYSILQETGEFLVEVLLKLENKTYEEVYERAMQAYSYRRQTQPFGVKTSGCFFKNISPETAEKLGLPTTSAGWLIDKAGLKGFKIGSFQISDIHANFIINLGEGDPQDLVKLIDLIKKTVKAKFGVDLELEVVLD